MGDQDKTGKCETCKKEFTYYIVHNGFNSSSYGYCTECGKTAFIDYYKIPEVIGGFRTNLGPILMQPEQNEQFLNPCECGGRFIRGAKPRCPHCQSELSAEMAAEYIEANAAKGWKWQKNWMDIYCIVIENNKTDDPWLDKFKK